MYCDLDGIKARYPEKDLIELTTDDVEATEPDSDIIEQAITDATAEIDSHLGKYTLPETIPNIIIKLCVELSVLNLYVRRSILTEEIKEKRKWCDDLLKKLSLKQIALPEDKTDPEAIFTGIRINSNPMRNW